MEKYRHTELRRTDSTRESREGGRMLAFTSNPEEIEIVRKQLQAHYEADEIVKGQYWEDGKGCAVGCILHSDNHAEFEKRFQIPEWTARLIDTLFEGMPNESAKELPIRFWDAVKTCEGKDLEPVKWQFLSFLMSENIERVKRLDISEALKTQVLGAIKQCKDLFDAGTPSGQELESARSAAWSATRSAAESARSARSAAESARSAAESAWSAAWSATRSAAWSATRYAAESARSAAWSSATRYAAESARSAEYAAYKKYADKFIELLIEHGKRKWRQTNDDRNNRK